MAHNSNSGDHTHVTPELLQVMKHICSLRYIHDHRNMEECAMKSQTEMYQTLWLSPAEDVAHSLMRVINSKFSHLAALERIQRAQAAWPVTYALKWTGISDVSDFQQNSAHCMFAKLTVSYKKQDLTFFIKAAPRDMVMTRRIDNPMTDSVNGKILQQLSQAVRNADIKRHTIMYETSFNCTTVFDDTRQQDILPLHRMMDIDHEDCPFSLSFHRKQDFVFASVFEYIPGESVSDILKKDANGIHKILNSLSDFWQTIGMLGMDFGMIHNDLHAGNVFYNTELHKLMLIDYGQMTFPYEIQDVIRAQLDDIVKNEAWHNNIKPVTYAHLIGGRTIAYKDLAHFYTTHILDLATFMTNVYYYMCKTLDQQWHFFDELIKFDGNDDMIQVNLNITSCITEWYNAMLAVDNAEFLSASEKHSMHLIGEGMFFLSMIMIHVFSEKGWINSHVQKLNMSREILANAKIMHWGFQVNQNIVHKYVNTTKICENLLKELSNMKNSAHIITYLFGHSLILKKMTTPYPDHTWQTGGKKQMSYAETTAKEWVERYKYLEGKDTHDDRSLQSLAQKDRNNVSITAQEKSPNLTRANTILRQSFSAAREPVLAYGGKQKHPKK